MTSILLLHPPVAKPSEPPPGLAALAGCLRHHGINCTLLDANLEALLFLLTRDEVPLASDTWSTRALRHRRRNLDALRSPVLYQNQDRYQRAVRDLNRALELTARIRPEINLSLSNYQDGFNPLESGDLLLAAAHPERSPFFPWMQARLPDLLAATNPGWIGVSLGYLSQAIPTFALLGMLRRLAPQCKLVLGGGLLTSWMAHPAWNEPFADLVDHCIAGPGEEPLLRLLDYGGQITTTAPDFTGLPLADYLAPGPILPYAASRGCAWSRCTFCPETAEQNRYRPLPVPTVLDHLSQPADLGCPNPPALIHLLDNALSPSLLRALADHPLPAPWYGFVRFHQQLADPAFCRHLRASGCVLLKLGLESGSQEVLDAMDKGVDLDLMARVLTALHQAGIATYVYLLFGTPRETVIEARQTMAFVVAHQKAITFLNLAIFNMPITSQEAGTLPGTAFSLGDLSLYLDFVHPRGWDRRAVRTFLDREFRRQPHIAAILRRDPPLFTSNHAPLFSGDFPWSKTSGDTQAAPL